MSVNDGPGGVRAEVERRSATPLVFLHRLPRAVLPIFLAALLVAGLVASGWVAAIPLLILAAIMGWLGYLSWPALDPVNRLLRVAALVILLAVAGGHASGQF